LLGLDLNFPKFPIAISGVVTNGSIGSRISQTLTVETAILIELALKVNGFLFARRYLAMCP
jgi:hypothetical protein